jgi:hypothetical protein
MSVGHDEVDTLETRLTKDFRNRIQNTSSSEGPPSTSNTRRSPAFRFTPMAPTVATETPRSRPFAPVPSAPIALRAPRLHLIQREYIPSCDTGSWYSVGGPQIMLPLALNLLNDVFTTLEIELLEVSIGWLVPEDRSASLTGGFKQSPINELVQEVIDH